MRLPTVSVIMASYNHADFVKQAIESVLAQQGVDFEFLIADDGSTDQTREVIASIKDERIQFFPNEVNRGACIVTNELIGRASGEFIALINSDDYWCTPEKLAYQVQILREKPDVGACFGRAIFIDKDGIEIDKTEYPFAAIFNQENRSQGKWLRHFFVLGNCICHPTMLIRKICYTELGLYNNRLRQLPDFDMWIRLIKRYQIHVSDRKLINFRILPGENASCQTAANNARIFNEYFLIAENFFKDVTRQQLIEGFSDLLIVKDVPSEAHLNIEKTMLFFVENSWLGRPYVLLGLLNMFRLLNDNECHYLLVSAYGIEDHWFHNKMSKLDILRFNETSNTNSLKLSEDHANEIQNLTDSINFLQKKLSYSEGEIVKICTSTSWQVTKPLRSLGQFIRNLVFRVL
jgi:glycosyltransferase involved in cell wall biosynthesis